MKILRDNRGQATTITALCLACLCGMAGFAVDVGTLFHAKRVLQTAADAAAIAGQADLAYGTASTSAKAIASQNGVTDGSNGYTVTVNTTPVYGPYKDVSNHVEVIASQSAPTYFMKLFGLKSMTVSARAVAGSQPSTTCIYTLDPSGIDVGLTGTGSLSMPDCGISVNSASSNAVDLTGVSSLIAKSIGIVGGYVNGSNTILHPTPVTGIAPVSNPMGFITPPSYTPSSCLPDPHVNSSGSTTLGPSTPGGTACYNGLSISGSGSVTLNPGIYVINGAFQVSGSTSITGDGVMIYLSAPLGSLSLTGSGVLNLSAPCTDSTSSDPCTSSYPGILFYEDAADTTSMKVSGSTGSDIQGIFYAPNAALTVTGSSGSTFSADLVVHALTISGTGKLQNYSDVNKYSTPLTTARLVE